MSGKAGDRIVVESEQVGTPTREGDVLEVLEYASGISYRVKWADGHESVFRPSVGSAQFVRTRKRQRT